MPRTVGTGAAGGDHDSGHEGSQRGVARRFVPLSNAVLVVSSVVLTLLAGELALRLYHGKVLTFTSQLLPPPNRLGGPVALYHAELGWVPRPGTFERSERETWSVDEAGLRKNGSSPVSMQRPIVAVGDSFTFGDEVFDHATWPAHLERELGVPVLNGGVFAYGADQAYLRAGHLVKAFAPGVLILAFISDDINRTEFSYYSGWKPYFAYDGDELRLRNVPVPTDQVPEPPFGAVRRALSYSFLCSSIVSRVAGKWWSYGAIVRVHHDGERVTVDLLDRLRARAAGANARFVAVALATDGRIGNNQRIPRVIERARARGVEVLDRAGEVEQIPTEMRAAMFMPRGHYSPRLNGLVAARVAAYLRQTP